MDKNNNTNQIHREFSLTTFAVDNATSIFLLTFMILLFGTRSYINMPKEAFPEIVIPTISVFTVYPGNSAVDMENLVTRPIEKEIKSISGVKDFTSTSQQDFANIIVEFGTDIDIDKALQEVKDAVDKSELPNDLPNDPTVSDINFSEIPIMTVNISGNLSVDELRNYAEYLQDEIEGLSEISEAKIKGALEREVQIDVDLPKMQALKLNFRDIETAIAQENVTMSGGELKTGDLRRALRIVGEFKEVSEIENIIIKSERMQPVYLRDFADVRMGFEERTSYARSDGLPVVSLDVIKRAGENLLGASDKIKAIVEKASKDKFPEELKVSLFNDLSIQTRDQVDNLQNSIISGVILVVVILLFFLGFRNSLFVGVAIPLSMLMGILILNSIGYTLNMVVLFSLILSLGMLVDNAIVVVENIYRYRQEGYSGAEAAKKGTGEVAWPIIASTATTLAAFLPLAFWPGIMGSFMSYLPITLIIVLSSSLFVALVINPVLTSALMRVDEKADDAAARKNKVINILSFTLAIVVVAIIAHFSEVMWLRNLMSIVAIITVVNFFLLRPASFFFQNKVLPILERGYDKFIRIALHKIIPHFTLLGTFALLIGAIMMLGISPPKVEFFPIADPLYVNVFVETPIGSDIETTNQIVKEIEEKVTKTVEPYGEIVEAVLTQIGEGTADPAAPPEPGASPHKARITTAFVVANKRGDLSTIKIMDEIRENLKGYAGLSVVVDQNQDGPPTGKPINLEISGDDMVELSKVSADILRYLNDENVAGVEELRADVVLGKPELTITVNRDAARRYEVSTQQVAAAIRTSVFGIEVSKFKSGEDEYPIQLRVSEKYRNDINALLGQRVTFRSQASGSVHQVPISAVADIRYSSTYSSVKRKDMKRMISIYSNVLKGYNANEIIEELKYTMDGYDMPQGYEYVFTGEQEEQAEAMAFLSSAFMVALFMIFIILVTQFNSISSPIIILLSIVFSTIGVFLGYIVTGMDLVIIMFGVGTISLAGIVVNNAIVLIDYIELTLKRMRDKLGLKDNQELPSDMVKSCIVQGGKTRLRPVLLTAITTVLGLIPLAIGFNFNFFTFISRLDPQIFIGGDNAVFWGPMAWTVIYGLTFATFLTLVVVPVMYWLSFLLTRFAQRILNFGPTTWSAEDTPFEDQQFGDEEYWLA